MSASGIVVSASAAKDYIKYKPFPSDLQHAAAQAAREFEAALSSQEATPFTHGFLVWLGPQCFAFTKDALHVYLRSYWRKPEGDEGKPREERMAMTLKERFTSEQLVKIQQLLEAKCAAPTRMKKGYRDVLRRMGFYITEWRTDARREFGPEDLIARL